uniref:Uncharacterized protein n=1 Tax=Arundo donax TaxID=35708 RepID=A0A0A8ZGI5_ARUDO
MSTSLGVTFDDEPSPNQVAPPLPPLPLPLPIGGIPPMSFGVAFDIEPSSGPLCEDESLLFWLAVGPPLQY